MDAIISAVTSFYEGTGISELVANPELLIKTLIMYVIIGVLFYFGLVRKFV